VLTGSAAYAVKEFFGLRGSLAEKAMYRPTFYGLIVLAIIGGLLMNFLNIDPIEALVVTAIINGVVAPPILVLIALLARDREVMGDRRSGRWSNGLVWAATLLMGAAAIALLPHTALTPPRPGRRRAQPPVQDCVDTAAVRPRPCARNVEISVMLSA
jgi:Mn2+/Fe2+ NRAMP family transporter